MVGKFWLKLGKLPGHLVIDFSAMQQDERATAVAAAAQRQGFEAMCSVSYIQSGPAILSLSPASLNLILPSLT